VKHPGTLTLKRFNGEEKYAISSAEVWHYTYDDYTVLNFLFETSSPALKTAEDTAELKAEPNGEFMVVLNQFDWDTLPGSEFDVPNAYDERIHDHPTRFYYCAHEDVMDCKINVIKRGDDGTFKVLITGRCVDVNFYDGSKPETEIVIDALFSCRGQTK